MIQCVSCSIFTVKYRNDIVYDQWVKITATSKHFLDELFCINCFHEYLGNWQIILEKNPAWMKNFTSNKWSAENYIHIIFFKPKWHTKNFINGSVILFFNQTFSPQTESVDNIGKDCTDLFLLVQWLYLQSAIKLLHHILK